MLFCRGPHPDTERRFNPRRLSLELSQLTADLEAINSAGITLQVKAGGQCCSASRVVAACAAARHGGCILLRAPRLWPVLVAAVCPRQPNLAHAAHPLWLGLQDVSCGNILVRGDGTFAFADFGYSWMTAAEENK